MGAWGRVQALVRNVLLLMEASSPPYQHSSESLGMLLKFLIDRREFWRAFHLVRYATQHPALRGKVEPWLQARLHEAERHYGDRELFDPAQFAREGAG